jgi:hypothetical protein
MYANFFRNRGGSLEKAGRELGFKVKYHDFDDIGAVTFLKGWWRSTGQSLVWLPLPSAVLKIGKLLRPATELVGGLTRNQKRSEEGRKIAVAMMANALARSYGNIPFSYPILGPFLHKMSSFSTHEDKQAAMAAMESWKPKVHGDIVLSAEAVDAVCRRYKITPVDVARVDMLISRVTSLPAYVQDPVFLRLAQVDY